METITGNIIRRLRKANDLTHKTLGEKIGVGPSTISSYENSGTMPPVDKLEALAQVFGIKMSVLIGESEEASQQTPYSIGVELVEELRATLEYMKAEMSKLTDQNTILIKALIDNKSGSNFSRVSSLKISQEEESPETTDLYKAA